jgi:hypothetical protein
MALIQIKDETDSAPVVKNLADLQDVKENQPDSLAIIIERLRSNLMHIVDIECGLLDLLLAEEVLTQQQIDSIRGRVTLFDQLTQLIDDIVKSSSDKQEQFLTALEENQQSHVAIYIRANGVRPADNPDNWPLVLSEKHLSLLDRNRPQLIELIDSKNGLFDELFTFDWFSSQLQQHLEADGLTNSQRNTRFCLSIRRRSVLDFKDLITCLIRTKQHHVASLLAPDETSNERPINEKKRLALKRKHPSLVETIDVNGGLLDTLVACNCITQRQNEYINSATSQSARIRSLLDILRRGSETDFNKFVKCLKEMGQQHVCDMLSDDVTVVHMVSKIKCNNSTDGIESDESRIVENFKEYFKTCPPERREQLHREINLCFEELESRDIDIVHLGTGRSITVFFLCRSSYALRHLFHLYENEQLKRILQHLYNELLCHCQAAVVQVDSLEWEKTSYNECMCDFALSMNLPELSTVYRLALQTQIVAAHYDAFSLNIADLPIEMIEILLVKAAGQLFVTINRVTSRAEIYTLVTLCAVSTRWWHWVTNRKYVRQQLKHYFSHICFPFNCSPRHFSKVCTADGRNVRSMAEINGKLYVACYKSNVLDVFNSTPPFGRCEGIEVRGMINPIDIVACSETNQLFIADSDHRAVWRVDLSRDKDVMQLITLQWMPFCMSIKSRRVLLTPYVGATLHLFSDAGSELNQIELPRYMQATHAVETTNKTFLVCYLNRSYDDAQCGTRQCQRGGCQR